MAKVTDVSKISDSYCRHCGTRIRACNCGCYDGLHWESAKAYERMGSVHCETNRKQLHEPLGLAWTL